MTGTLFGLGIGPGDPELITLKALRLLRQADVVVYPAPLEGATRARDTVAAHLTTDQEEIPVRLSMRADEATKQRAYAAAAERIRDALDAGRDVAVLCEGDPFLYGSFTYIFIRLADGYPVEVVPGISSITAAPAVALAPPVTREDVFTVLPATLPVDALEAGLKQADSAAILKLGRHLTKMTKLLERLGLADHAIYVENATTPAQKVAQLSSVDEAAPYFSMILVRCTPERWR